MTVERKWQMTRVGAGDYLLPSNDRQTLWRIHKYWEDGSAFYYDDERNEVPIRGHFWQLYRLRVPLAGLTDAALAGPVNWDGDEWVEEACMFKTRSSAIEAAMDREPVAS